MTDFWLPLTDSGSFGAPGFIIPSSTISKRASNPADLGFAFYLDTRSHGQLPLADQLAVDLTDSKYPLLVHGDDLVGIDAGTLKSAGLSDLEPGKIRWIAVATLRPGDTATEYARLLAQRHGSLTLITGKPRPHLEEIDEGGVWAPPERIFPQGFWVARVRVIPAIVDDGVTTIR